MHLSLLFGMSPCVETPHEILPHVEDILLLIYLADVVLKMLYQGPRVYFAIQYKKGKFSVDSGKVWQLVFSTTVALLCAERLFLFKSRPFRFLRPVILILRFRNIRRYLLISKNLMLEMPGVLVPSFIFAAFMGLVAARVFPAQSLSFRTSIGAVYELLMLSCTMDNYEEIVRPSSSVGFTIFITFFLAIGNLYMFSLVLGMTVELFAVAQNNQLRSEWRKEMKGLVKAFFVLTGDTTRSTLTMGEWKALLRSLRPEIGVVGAELYHTLLAGDQSTHAALLP